jgi:hypothetical protein
MYHKNGFYPGLCISFYQLLSDIFPAPFQSSESSLKFGRPMFACAGTQWKIALSTSLRTHNK